MINSVTELAVKQLLDSGDKNPDYRKLVAECFYDVNNEKIERIVSNINKRFGGTI
jgi:hypothetical protein